MSSNQQEQVFTYRARRLPYLLSLPVDYNPAQRWPLILFLHGAGERGNNLDLLKIYGIPALVEAGQAFPFIAVSPQCPAGTWWTRELEILTALLDEIERTYAVDADREYVTGLSMGGMGTWALAIANPHRFAAIAPVCGGDNPAKVCVIKHVPVWAFHGAKDPVVPLKASAEMVRTLESCGGIVRFTVYPDLRHDSWTPTYQNPELYRWLLEQRRVQTA